MPTFSQPRVVLVFTIFVILFLALTVRVGYLQTYGREQTTARADRQQHLNITLENRRGCVFDRNGMLMAGTIQTQTVFVDAKFMAEFFAGREETLAKMTPADRAKEEKKYTGPVDADDAIDRLAEALDKSPKDLRKLIAESRSQRFVKIATHVGDSTMKAIEKLDLPGVGNVPDSVRNYPMGSLAAHVLGGVGGEGRGLDGLELKFDKTLAGRDGYVRMTKDAQRRPINVAAEDYLPPVHGSHLVLTIDTNIQMLAEQELTNACVTGKAKRGEVVVIDPETGEILALANYPTFNPQNLNDSTKEVRTNHCLVSPYEPGSTIKPFIAGPALAWNITRPNEVFRTGGASRMTSYGRRISDVHGGYPQLSAWDILVKSSNIGMTLIGERMGNTKMWTALNNFQFGEVTGIELPGESGGRVNPLRRWSKHSTDSIPQGYELMVTPLQLARGFCAFANGGRLPTVSLVKGTLAPDGTVDPTNTRKVDTSKFPQVIDPATAADVRRILADVPVRGTCSNRGSKIYNVFGKTGTAHISLGRQGYSHNRYNSSFIGGAPYENPRLVVAFIVHDPDPSIAHYGGVVSAPYACKLLERSLAYLQVPPSPDLQPPPPAIAATLYNYQESAYRKVRQETASAATTH